MQILKTTFLLFFSVLTINAFAQSKDAILGKWASSNGEGQIEIFAIGGKYFGKLAWLKEPNNANGKPKLDTKNPTANLQNRPLLGLVILKDFVFDDGKWTDGNIYDPKTGKTYSCILSLKENGLLNIRGYVGISLIGRSETWKQVK